MKLQEENSIYKIMKNIDIVLATYNGEKYIADQLDSILAANLFDKFVNKIIISDDCSSDATNSILEDYSLKYPFIEIYKNSENKGVIGNFETAISISTGDYIILCDQDDVWMTDKLEILVNGIQQLENEANKNLPCLFFTDLQVVDHELNIINDSFFDSTNIDVKDFLKLNAILLMNITPGCSMIFNRKLKEISLPIKKGEIYIHDWWLLLLAFYGGNVGFSDAKTFKYRQHDNNAIGVNQNSLIMNLAGSILYIREPDSLYLIAKNVYDRLHSFKLISNDSVLVKLLSVKTKSRFTRLLFMFRNDIYFNSNIKIKTLIRNVRLIVYVLLKKIK